jgi:hypothetical protein
MKKVLLVSLLLVSIFLISSSVATATPVCTNYQDYICNWNDTLYGEKYAAGTDCLKLCFDNEFEVDINDYAGVDEFYGYLYPAQDSKHLLGTAYDFVYHSWAGCSVEFRGRSMITKLTYPEGNRGEVVVLKCKQYEIAYKN